MKIGMPLTCPPNTENLMHKVFGELIVIAYGGKDKYRQSQWWCQCACGTKLRVIGPNLNSGNTKSCGCRKNQGYPIHGMSDTPEYEALERAKDRCFNQGNPSYHYYGGRGITVCEEWQSSFEAFYKHIGDKPEPKEDYSLDRINNDGNYEPGNVRWATRTQQANNKQRN